MWNQILSFFNNKALRLGDIFPSISEKFLKENYLSDENHSKSYSYEDEINGSASEELTRHILGPNSRKSPNIYEDILTWDHVSICHVNEVKCRAPWLFNRDATLLDIQRMLFDYLLDHRLEVLENPNGNYAKKRRVDTTFTAYWNFKAFRETIKYKNLHVSDVKDILLIPNFHINFDEKIYFINRNVRRFYTNSGHLNEYRNLDKTFITSFYDELEEFLSNIIDKNKKQLKEYRKSLILN